MDNVILFDMDGTLVPTREVLPEQNRKLIAELLNADWRVGVVSGSPAADIRRQMGDMGNHVEIYGCNGTEVPGKPQGDMIMELGPLKYNSLVSIVMSRQLEFITMVNTLPEFTAIQLTGNFLAYRKSQLNWCLIGREANMSQREVFQELDENEKIREQMLEKIQPQIELLGGISVAIGGKTSLDIYPEGWDKSYCLRYFEPEDFIVFVGDRCAPGGNDYPLFDALRKRKGSWSLVTRSWEQTADIVGTHVLDNPYLHNGRELQRTQS